VADYIFYSDRLAFRQWRKTDIDEMSLINSDKDVMEFFPNTQSFKETREFVERMQKHYNEKSFCYFAVEISKSNEFIGFVGMSVPRIEFDFSPCIDLGWRLKKSAWGNGYATEAASACINYAFENLDIEELVAMAPKINTKSIHVMEKIGMTHVKNFKHPLLKSYPTLEECVLYKIYKKHKND
jgi:RimJ/RimL family protein N-acetyltransferase